MKQSTEIIHLLFPSLHFLEINVSHYVNPRLILWQISHQL